jgi:dinuclear metal center YbgI/SA1388 family protein
MKQRKREAKKNSSMRHPGYRPPRNQSAMPESIEPGLHTVGDFCEVMQTIVPAGLEQSWDNVGLIAGDAEAAMRIVLLAIDLTRPVLEEAVALNADLLLAYHPPIFKPIASLRALSTGMDGLIFEAVRAGLAIYSPHTALDAAEGGTNDVLAEACGAVETKPLVDVDSPGGALVKVAVYVPPAHADAVAQAMFEAGAGHIGKYSHCSFRAPGMGTFLGGPEANPAVGVKGRLERVDEVRLETIVPHKGLAAVVSALRAAHPYEEPAFDLYSLKPQPTGGIGRVGELPKPFALSALAKRLGRTTQAANIQIVGKPQQYVDRVIVVAGAAGSLPFQFPLTQNDAIITGELRHHDALTIQRIGCGAIVLGHWASERPVLAPLAARLAKFMPAVQFQLSRADADPFS